MSCLPLLFCASNFQLKVHLAGRKSSCMCQVQSINRGESCLESSGEMMTSMAPSLLNDYR